VRSKGLVYMGKGAIGVNPFHTDRQLMSPTAVAGLLATMMSFTDSKARTWISFLCFIQIESDESRRHRSLKQSQLVVLDKAHWLLYCLVPAMYPVSFSFCPKSSSPDSV
jgi:26S proteasome regulatory subunit N1